MSFTFTDSDVVVLKNFAGINQSMIIHPDRLEVMNNGKSLIGKYAFEKAYDFPEFGIYETPEFLQVLSNFKNYSITVEDAFITIKEDKNKVKYFTTKLDLIAPVPNLEPKFNKMTPELEFELPADRLAVIFKMASVLKCKYAFFETAEKKVRITLATELESSYNMFEVTIDSGITLNETKKPIKIPLEDMTILPMDYTVKIASKASKWVGVTGVEYFIGCAV